MTWREVLRAAGRRAGGGVTLGVFDGGHLGHRALLDALRGASPAVVVTFDRHPGALRGGAPPEIEGLEARCRRLAAWGADEVAVLAVSEDLLDTAAEDFAEALAEGLRPRLVAVGAGFRFGRGTAGDAAVLRAVGARRGFETREIPPVLVDGAPASSTRLRAALASGDFAAAARLLGGPFSARGRVVSGEGRGRGLGFPTWNVAPPPGEALPDGVYAAVVGGPAAPLPAAAYVGRRPTFGEGGRVLEAHLLVDDPPPPPEGETSVEFRAFLRGDLRFEGPDALAAQMRRDVEETRRRLR